MHETILLVDDEAGIRTVLGIALADIGYTVHTAENGKQALKVFGQVRPAIVLTDIKMPDMDGIELLRRIKAQDAETEVIMFTGHGDMELAIQSLKHDATDFVTKPIDDQVLEIALKRARERIDLRRQIREYTENLERMVDEKARQLIEAERMAAIGETIAGLSHTIKNIAGGLKGGIFVLEKGIELDNRPYLEQGWKLVRGNVDKIHGLSMDLLNYGKYADIHCQDCDPNKPAIDVVDLLKARAVAHNITLTLQPADDIAPCCMDPDAIHHCLLNIVTNALDACQEEAVADRDHAVNVTVGTMDGQGVQYRISDTGGGIHPEAQAKIFQSFFSTKGTEGTGIGLMLCRKIIDRHGGSIEIESASDKGATFIVKLPSEPPQTDKAGPDQSNSSTDIRIS